MTSGAHDRNRTWRGAIAAVAVIVTALLATRQLRPLVEAGTRFASAPAT